MSWGGQRVEPTPAGAGAADPWTEADARLLRLLLELDVPAGRVVPILQRAVPREGDPRRAWRRQEWHLQRDVRLAFVPGDGSPGGDLL